MIVPISVMDPATLGTIVAALVTVPVNQIWVVKRAVFTNVNPAATDKFTIYVCRGGAGAANSNTIIQERPLSQEQDDVSPELINLVLNGGDIIRGFSQFGNITGMMNGFRFQ